MSKLYLGGMPTGPDVKLLREAFPEITEGDEIRHEEIEAVLSKPHASSRYRTITDAWRRKLFDAENVEIVAVPGIGFKCLAPNERVDHGVKNFGYGTRKQGRSLRRLGVVPSKELDASRMMKRDHAQRLGYVLYRQALSMFREIEPPKPAMQSSQLAATIADRSKV